MVLPIAVGTAPSRSPPKPSMWIGTTSPICTKCASAWAPCECAQPVCRYLLAHQPRYAPDANSSASRGTSLRDPSSAAHVISKRSMPFVPAPRATRLSRSASCGKTPKATGCATNARQKRGLTDARLAKSTNQPENSSTHGKTSTGLSTPAARLAKRASNAGITSPTIGPWSRTHSSVRNAPLGQLGWSAPYATRHSTGKCSLFLNGYGD